MLGGAEQDIGRELTATESISYTAGSPGASGAPVRLQVVTTPRQSYLAASGTIDPLLPRTSSS